MSETSNKGRQLRLDPEAVSKDPDSPAFVSRPAGAPVYHGFPILDDVEVDGFRLGMITDWEAEYADVGDAFVVAPDNSRAGLNWEIAAEPHVTSVLHRPLIDGEYGTSVLSGRC